MNFWALGLMTLVLVALINDSESCSIPTDRPIEEVMDENANSPWLVLVYDREMERQQILQGLAYGSLIHPMLVMTTASVIASSKPEDLEVITNCVYKSEPKCDSKLVAKAAFRPGLEKEDIEESDWTILKLTEAFELSNRIQAVELASDGYDPEECDSYRWQVVISEFGTLIDAERDEGVLHTSYPVSMTPGSVGIKPEYEFSFDDLNCVIETCGNMQPGSMSLLGSPVVCRAFDGGRQVQVGFATIEVGIFDDENFNPVSNSTGTLVDFKSEFNAIKDAMAAMLD